MDEQLGDKAKDIRDKIIKMMDDSYNDVFTIIVFYILYLVNSLY
jgi:hypothetical protein